MIPAKAAQDRRIGMVLFREFVRIPPEKTVALPVI